MEETKNNQNAAEIISQVFENKDITPDQLQEISKKLEKEQEKENDQVITDEENFNKLTLEQLSEKLAEIVMLPFNEIKHKVDLIKNLYQQKRNEVLEELRQKFIEEGGKKEYFKTPMEVLEIDRKYKDALATYQEKKEEYEEQIRKEQEQNLEQKKQLIEKIKELIKSTENFDKVYRDFKNIEKQWNKIGNVPNQFYKDLMNEWNKVRRKFYDLKRINNELKEFDLQHNFEQKKAIIVKAEALLYYNDKVKAYRELQGLHRQWKEIGPVHKHKREEIWQKFSKISSEINKRYQEYLKKLKEIQKKNLEAKTRLCEAAEQIAKLNLETPKQWQEKTKIIIELQQLWRKVGRVPKKYNQTIYERFRKACDTFFERKREFFNLHKELLEENLKKKEKIAEYAEKLKETSEWRKAARELERLFEEWKKIGPVPKGKSEEIWQRFRTARLEFFRRKRQFLKEQRKQEKENLNKKLKLIEEIKNLELSDNQEENIKLLQSIEDKWNSIGFVPFKDKDRINKLYKQTLNEKFAKVNLDSESRQQIKFRLSLEKLLKSPNAKNKILKEIEKQKSIVQKLKDELLKLENNLEIFKNSPKEFLAEFKKEKEYLKNKIEKLQNHIDLLVQEYKKLQ